MSVAFKDKYLKYLKIMLIIICVLVLLVGVDLFFIFNINRPLFVIQASKIDDFSVVYKGVFYDTYNCAEYSVPQIKVKGNKFSCAISRNDGEDIVDIVDTTKDIESFICAESLEQFYEDDYYTYYWNCIKNDYMIVKYKNEFEETISDALKHKSISINDLDRYKIDYIKIEKDIPNKTFNIVIKEDENCNLKLNEYFIYEDRKVYTVCINEIYIESDNGNKITLDYHFRNINQSFDRSIKQLVSDATIENILKDGGTTIYKKDNYTIIICNTVSGNKDIYIGNKDFKFEQVFCK